MRQCKKQREQPGGIRIQVKGDTGLCQNLTCEWMKGCLNKTQRFPNGLGVDYKKENKKIQDISKGLGLSN